LAEFAIVFPVFMLILGAVIQFGIAFWDQNTLNQVVRDAGRYAATVQTCGTAGTDDIRAKTAAIEAATPFAGSYGTITVTLPAPGSDPVCPPTDNSEVVWVLIKAEATVPAFFPFFSGHIESQATFRMEPRAP
jgi:Flp pilus assembly protein TadG